MSTQRTSDPTSIGAILLEMGTITQEQLENAIEQQERSSLEIQLGNQLIVLGYCSKQQIDLALAAQERLRKNKHEHALAVVDIALARKKATNGRQQQMIDSCDRVARRTDTGQGYPAVSQALLAKNHDDR